MKKTIFTVIFAVLATMAPMLWAQLNAEDYKITQNPDNTITIDGITGTAYAKYIGSTGTLTIPDTLYGLKVTAIGNSAFSISEYWPPGGIFQKLVIPDSITRIGNRAFDGQDFTSVTLGRGLRIIGDRAFAGNKLTEIVFPNTVTEIGEQAFSGNLLTELTLPPSVRKVGSNAFRGHYVNTEIGERGTFVTANNITTLVIPASLVNGQIGGSDFRYSPFNFGSLTRITLPAGMSDDLMKRNFEENLANFYISQNRTAGIYVKNGPIWVRE